MTYSMIAVEGTYIGGVTASGSIAVGSRVLWCKYKVGGVITQGYTNPSLGPVILNLMEKDRSPQEALDEALSMDRSPEVRQVGVISAYGEVAIHCGSELPGEVGWSYREGSYVALGNLLSSREVIDRIVETFLESGGDLVWRLLSSLKAGQKAGGDARGDRAAAILVVGPTEYGRSYDRIMDLRIDFSPEPVEELIGLVEIFLSRER